MAAKKIESPAGTGQIADQNTNAASVAPAEKIGKARLARLKVEFALRGFEVRECNPDGYFVTKWNLTKFCRELADLESFAAQVGARP